MLMMWTMLAPAHAGPFLDRNWAVYGEMIGGAAQDGNGWYLLPCCGPIPIDPQWYTGTELPVVVLTYTDTRERTAIQDALERQVAVLGEPFPDPWFELTRIEDILRYRNELTFVSVTGEAAAIAWLDANRRAVAELDHLTVLFVDEAGPAIEALERW